MDLRTTSVSEATYNASSAQVYALASHSYLQTSGRAMEEHFAWEIPIYKLNLLLGGAFRVGNFYLQTQLERFVWEISIYKLN